MRYAVVVLPLIALACSRNEAPASETSPPTGSATSQSQPSSLDEDRREGSWEQAPVIQLMAVGTPPLKTFRRSFEAGSKEVLEMETRESVFMKGGGLDTQHLPLGIAQTIDVETRAVSPDGVAEVAFEVRAVDVVETSVASPGAQLMDTTGVTGTYNVNSLGVVSNLELRPAPGARRPEYIGALRSELRWMAPPFPEEAIGVGAKWTVSGVINERRTQMNERAEVELVEVTESGVVLRFDVESAGTREPQSSRGPQTTGLDVSVHGQASLDPNRLAPSVSTLDMKMVQRVMVVGADKPAVPLDVTSDRKISVRRE